MGTASGVGLVEEEEEERRGRGTSQTGSDDLSTAAAHPHSLHPPPPQFPMPVLASFIKSFSIINELAHKTETQVMEDYLVRYWKELPQLGPLAWRVLHLGKNDTKRLFTTVSVRELKNGYGMCPRCYPGLMPDQPTVADAKAAIQQQVLQWLAEED